MHTLSERFVYTLGLWLLAAYAPSVLWAPSLIRQFNSDAIFLFYFTSPISFIALMLSFKMTGILCSAGVFIIGLISLSAAVCRLKSVKELSIVIALVIFVYSLLQGMVFANAIRAINALG